MGSRFPRGSGGAKAQESRKTTSNTISAAHRTLSRIEHPLKSGTDPGRFKQTAERTGTAPLGRQIAAGRGNPGVFVLEVGHGHKATQGCRVNVVWVVVGFAVVGAVLALVTSRQRRDQPSDLGAVSYQRISEHRQQGQDLRRDISATSASATNWSAYETSVKSPSGSRASLKNPIAAAHRRRDCCTILGKS